MTMDHEEVILFNFLFADLLIFLLLLKGQKMCVFLLCLSLIVHPFVSKCQEQRAVGVMFKYNRHVRPDAPLRTIWSVLPTAVTVI